MSLGLNSRGSSLLWYSDEMVDYSVSLSAGPTRGESRMTNATVKEEARKLVERLPDDATWEVLQYEIYLRQAVESGLKDSREARVVPLEEARRRLGLESA